MTIKHASTLTLSPKIEQQGKNFNAVEEHSSNLLQAK